MDSKYKNLVDAAKGVVATVNGNNYGLTSSDVIEAIQMATEELNKALKELGEGQ